MLDEPSFVIISHSFHKVNRFLKNIFADEKMIVSFKEHRIGCSADIVECYGFPLLGEAGAERD